ncbi:MAG TPA: hypothetical protein VMS89_09915 [Methanoregulaceae archaeon]|nr:hypothetical protein [Methanoregulaceae archaeon]
MPGSSWFQPGLALNIFVSLFLIVIIPLLLGELVSIPPGPAAGLIVATLIIEYSAPVAGLAAGLPPVYTGVAVIFVASGVIFLQYSVFDAMYNRSEKVRGFLESIRQKYGGSERVKRYRVLALAPAILTVGFYISPAISWLFGWDRKISFLVMMSVYSLATAGVLIAGLGIIRWVFG